MGGGPGATSRKQAPGGGAGTPLVFRLRYRGQDVWLSRGQMLIGRGPDCALMLGDPLVSRVHARLIVGVDSVTIEDAGSSNGVAVNGERLQGARRLGAGDSIVIGQQELVLVTTLASGQVQRQAPTLPNQPAASLDDDDEDADSAPTAKCDMLDLIGSMADKALALRRPDEAERLLATHLGNTLKVLEAGQSVPAERVETAARYALKLASATGKGAWADYVIRVYAASVQPLPAPIVDGLYVLVRKVPLDLRLLREYLVALRSVSARFGPAERFLVQRAAGLEPLVAR